MTGAKALSGLWCAQQGDAVSDTSNVSLVHSRTCRSSSAARSHGLEAPTGEVFRQPSVCRFSTGLALPDVRRRPAAGAFRSATRPRAFQARRAPRTAGRPRSPTPCRPASASRTTTCTTGCRSRLLRVTARPLRPLPARADDALPAYSSSCCSSSAGRPRRQRSACRRGPAWPRPTTGMMTGRSFSTTTSAADTNEVTLAPERAIGRRTRSRPRLRGSIPKMSN